MRFRTLQYFAALEGDPRADESEGKAHLQIAADDVQSVHFDKDGNVLGVSSAPGYLNFQSEFVNAIFVCCFSYPPEGDPTKLPKRFGNHVVRIDDPLQLARDVAERMTLDGFPRDTPVLECVRIVYDKGEKRSKEPGPFERTQLNLSQKPPRYSDEYEFRLATIDPRPRGERVLEDEYHDVVIGRPLPYAKLL